MSDEGCLWPSRRPFSASASRIASGAEGIAPGEHVLHFGGWREYDTVDAKEAVKIGPQAAPLSTYLGALG